MLDRKKVAMVVAEFLGTGVLTLGYLSVSKSNLGLPFFVAVVAGVVAVAMMLVLRSVSGAQFNPAVTVALWTARRVKTMPAVMYVAAQLLGGWAAYWLFKYYVNQGWSNVGHYSAKVLVAEAVGTAVLGLAWGAVAYNKLEDSKAASVIGVALVVGILVASATTTAILNPAVALGVRMWGWGTYVLGPVLGAVLGVNLYGLLFAPAETKVAAKKK
ncbi:MAG TPA: aquaporin [Candidatus Saccharimonadales bacterium]|nr:aquaporin [Candidatus Saccharimonadales bacterium]